MKKVLVVDNHPVLLKLMTNLLEKNGYQALTAEDGLTALDVLETYIPDVIFIDLIMPNIDGEKLCRIIRRMPELKDVCIIILSGIAAEHDVNFAEFGADACIAKGPFEKMGKHVLAALTKLELGTIRDMPAEVVGLDDIRTRDIAKELLSVKRHLETILESMAEGVLEITSEGRVVYVNEIALSLIGRPEEKLLASNFVQLFSESDRKRIQGMVDAVGTSHLGTPEDSPVTLHGRQVSVTMVPIVYTGYKGIIVIMNDVSERKRMENQLRYAQKMEAIGTLAGGIAHDFNNLLMGVQGNASLLLLDIDSTDPCYIRLKNIEKQVQSGSKLTAQLIGYARKGKYEFRPIDLNQVVRDTSDTFGRTKKEIRIRRQLDDDLSSIEADQGQIEQVLLNLYINALQAMPGGGDIFLRTMNITHEDMKNKLYDPKPGNYVLFVITDTGEGMDKETQKRIFDPFFTTKEMGRGTGMGLASVYGIIKGHSGYIDVGSEKGSGTTFEICFPASERVVAREHKKRPEGTLKGSETVLFVDDEEVIVEVGTELLEAMDYKVLSAKSGKEAIEIYKRNKEGIDIVVLDMIMPGMSGGETYDRMREIDPDIRVLLSSGYSLDGLAAKILERGCNGFLQKPFDMEHLYQGIREILDAA